MNLDPREIEQILSVTPDSPENAELISLLTAKHAAAKIVKWPYSVNAQFFVAGANNGLANAATATVNVNIDASAPFIIVSQSFYANTANATLTVATQVIPNVIVLLTDTGSNRQLMDVAVPIWNIFGNGQFPFVLPEPKLMQANSQLQVTVTNREAAIAFNLYLTFSGYRLYKL